MKRFRTFNAAPARTSSETALVISNVIAASLKASSHLDATATSTALTVAEPAILMLVSSRNLETIPLVLVAGETTLEIRCRYDGEAVGGEENLNPVPGMSSATSYLLHLPAPDPIRGAIEAIAKGHPALTTEDPGLHRSAEAAATPGADRTPLDLAALKDLL